MSNSFYCHIIPVIYFAIEEKIYVFIICVRNKTCVSEFVLISWHFMTLGWLCQSCWVAKRGIAAKIECVCNSMNVKQTFVEKLHLYPENERMLWWIKLGTKEEWRNRDDLPWCHTLTHTSASSFEVQSSRQIQRLTAFRPSPALLCPVWASSAQTGPSWGHDRCTLARDCSSHVL